MSESAESPKTLRVLYVLGSLDPKTGGPAQSAPHMWISARRAGIDVTAAFVIGEAADDSVGMLARLSAEGIRLRSFPVTIGFQQNRRWGVSWGLAVWLIRHAKDYDIIHGHGAWMFSTFIALLAAMLSRKHFILTPHESLTKGDVDKGRRTIATFIKKAIKKLYATSCDSILFASYAEKNTSEDQDATLRRAVLYHPVIDERLGTQRPMRNPSSLQPIRVGYLGRFDPKKNLELLIKAVKNCPGVLLSIAGGGAPDYEDKLRKLAHAENIAARVSWLGFISATQRAEFFASIDVLVMPSVFEGFGMVAAEALSCGVPVIVTRASGIAELVTKYDCGIVIDATLEAVVEAMSSLQKNPDRLAAFSERGQDMARQELTFSVYGAKLFELYRNLGSSH